jgi:ferredoxin-type protein NapH
MTLLPLREKTAAIIWWQLPVVAVGGWFWPYLGYLLIPCMIAPIAIGTIRGRHWCGWFCPRGAFFDYVMARVSGTRRPPAWMTGSAFRVVLVALLIGLMAAQIASVWPNPRAIGLVFVRLLAITTVAGIALALVFDARAWCSVCPMGSMASWVSHGKRPVVVSDACRTCGACERVCTMGLTPHAYDRKHADCLKCGRCAAKCPVKALSFGPNRPARGRSEPLRPGSAS